MKESARRFYHHALRKKQKKPAAIPSDAFLSAILWHQVSWSTFNLWQAGHDYLPPPRQFLRPPACGQLVRGQRGHGSGLVGDRTNGENMIKAEGQKQAEA